MSTAAASSVKSVGGAGGAEEDVNGSAHALRALSESTASPRVSTTGEITIDEPKKQVFAPEGADFQAPGLDALHWGGVKKRGDFDQRSVASSMNAEKDDKSIYGGGEEAVGAVEEAEEETDDEEEAPEEIVLGQVQAGLAAAALGGAAAPAEQRALAKQGSGAEATSPRPSLRWGPSSVAHSTDAENGSLRPTSEDGEGALDEVALGRGAGAAAPPPPREASAPRDIAQGQDAGGAGAPPPLGTSMAASSAAASPRSPAACASPLFGRSVDTDGLHAAAAAALPLSRPAGGGGGGGGGAQPYHSRLMQQLVTGDEAGAGEGDADEGDAEEGDADEGDRHTHYSSSVTSAAVSHAGSAAVEPAPARAAPAPQPPAPTAPAAAAPEASPPPPPPPPPAEVHALEVEAANAGAAAATFPAGPPPRVDLGPEWEGAFQGLLYTDGIDALGRPVVVLNADAVPPRMRSSAVAYVKAHLEPLVNAGDYVMVFTARKASLPSLWIMGAYQSLPRPYRKNVQYVLLVRPSPFLRAVLAFMRPFVSRKAGRKIRAVESLAELAAATGGEVGVPHLGQRFLDDDAAAQEAEEGGAAAAAP